MNESALIRIACCCLVLSLVAGCAGGDAGSAAPAAAPAATLDMNFGMSSDEPVAFLGDQAITRGELLEAARGDLMRAEFEKYDLLEVRLKELAEKRVLEAEAARRGITVDELIKAEVDDKVVPPTDEEVVQVYQRNARGQNQALEAVRHLIARDLERQAKESLRRQLIDGLLAQTKFRSVLDAPRVELPEMTGAPARGSKDAPITMVEFSDFECPFCRRVYPTVEQVLSEYGDKIRFVYRDYPLRNHTRARFASKAALCAGEQDKYWQYYNELMAIQGDLSDGDLTNRATKLGLDTETFSACYQSDRHDAAIEAGFNEAVALGLRGTPTFFINGRVLRGAKPYDEFKRVLEEELARVN